MTAARNRTVRGTKSSAVVVLIPKQLRAEWVDVMALDADLSNNAFRVACVIGSYFNKYRGEAYPKIETIAAAMGAAARTAWGGVKELEARGYLIVERREFGTIKRRLKDGTEKEVRLAGGRVLPIRTAQRSKGRKFLRPLPGQSSQNVASFTGLKGRKFLHQRSQRIATQSLTFLRKVTLRARKGQAALTGLALPARCSNNGWAMKFTAHGLAGSASKPRPLTALRW